MDTAIVSAAQTDVSHPSQWIKDYFSNNGEGNNSRLIGYPPVVSSDQFCRLEFTRTSLEKDSARFTLRVKDLMFERVTLRQHLPAVHVKPEHVGKYRIAWCPKIGHNICKEIKTEIVGVIQGFPITPRIMDIHMNTVYRHIYDEYQEWIGNVDLLTKPKESLPSYTLNVPIRFFYTQRSETGVRGMMLINGAHLAHTFSLRRKLSELLVAEEYDEENESWSGIKVSHILDKLIVEESLDAPQLFARCSVLTHGELEQWSRAVNNGTEYSCLISEWRELTIERESKGKKDGEDEEEKYIDRTIDLKSDYCISAIAWAAVDRLRETFNYYNTYTKPQDEFGQELSPIVSSSCSHGDDYYWQDAEAIDHLVASSEEFGFTPPRDKIFFHHFGPDNNPLHSVYLNDNQTKLTAKLERDRKYNVTVFMQVYGILKYENNDVKILYVKPKDHGNLLVSRVNNFEPLSAPVNTI